MCSKVRGGLLLLSETRPLGEFLTRIRACRNQTEAHVVQIDVNRSYVRGALRGEFQRARTGNLGWIRVIDCG